MLLQSQELGAVRNASTSVIGIVKFSMMQRRSMYLQDPHDKTWDLTKITCMLAGQGTMSYASCKSEQAVLWPFVAHPSLVKKL